MPAPIPIRPTAADSWSRIDAHEQVCAERYKTITDRLEDHGKKLDGIGRAAWTAALSIGASGFAAIVYLVVRLVPGLHP